jgi:folate-dependent phosphoribosylglycinamide formyltransferase PurN
MSDVARRPRLAVMLSGSGRTLTNLAESIREGRLEAEIPVVIASRECLGAQRARDMGIETLVLPGRIRAAKLEDILRKRRIDYVALAGYLNLVEIPESYRGRVVNIHPALLPDFGGPGMYGNHVHAAVLASGRTETGCTVHICDDHYDKGDAIVQLRCPVFEGDTVATLAARVFELEKRAYPEALRILFARDAK